MIQSAKEILLVENSNTARLSLKRKLTNMGYVITAVSSGREAVAVFQQKPFVLVIMDVFLPELNGYEAAQQMRALENNSVNIPIIAYSSSTSPFDREKCFNVGINAYVIKSSDHQALLDSVSKLLN